MSLANDERLFDYLVVVIRDIEMETRHDSPATMADINEIAKEAMRNIDQEIGDIPVEVIEAAHKLEFAGGEAQLLAEFVLELGVKT